MVRIVALVAAVLVAAAVVAAVAFAARSPRALRSAMFAAARKQHALHYVEQGAAPGLKQKMVSDVGAKSGIQRISFTAGSKKGQFTVRVVNRVAYLRGNTIALDAYLGFTAAQAAKYSGRWISARPGQPKYSDWAASVTMPSFLHDIYPRAPLTLVTAKLGGRSVTGVRGVNRESGGIKFVEAVFPDSKLRPLGVSDIEPTKGFLDALGISRWNEAVHVTAPPNAVPVTTVLAG